MKKITLLFIMVLAVTFGYAQNLFTDGTFDDPAAWTEIHQIASNNGTATIANGVATFEENVDIPDWSWGNESHVGITKTFTVPTSGWYQFDAEATVNGIANMWFEVWVGETLPIPNQEYNADFGAKKMLNLNAWDCSDYTTYSGSMLATGCNGLNGEINLVAGTTYHIVIRAGGFDFGTGGVILDNLTLTSTAAPVLLTEFSFDFDSPTPLEGSESATFNDDATNTVTDGNNPTTNVGEISGINLSWWSQLKYQYDDGVDLSTGDKGFSIKVKGPRALPVTIKVEGSEEHSVTVGYTTPNVWQELKFDFSSFTTNTNTKIAVFFGMQEDDTVFPDVNDNIFQIDDFTFGKYTTLKVQEFEIEGLAAYPNPTNSKWTISTINQQIQAIDVYNVIGKRVLSLKPNTMSANVDA
ncbi:MAG: hypothetical protein IZT56_10665, partial [Bacteroidetes bacterium]|nr:hypothetical protein [Bacteroidota bacterium]